MKFFTLSTCPGFCRIYILYAQFLLQSSVGVKHLVMAMTFHYIYNAASHFLCGNESVNSCSRLYLFNQRKVIPLRKRLRILQMRRHL